MNSYELLYVINAEVEEEARAALIAKFNDLIAANNGSVDNVDEWGTRKYAYPINYKNEGYYVLVNFKSAPSFIDEFERNLRINENVVRFMVVKK